MKNLFLVFILSICASACDDIIEVEDISDQNIVLVAPTDLTTLNISSVTFSWDPLEDADTYHIQISRPNFENALQIVLDSTISITSLTTTLDTDNYQWRVRAENSDFHTTYSTNSFSIEE